MKKLWITVLILYAWWLLPFSIIYASMIKKNGIEHYRAYIDQFYAMIGGAFAAIVLSVILSFIIPRKTFIGISGVWKYIGLVFIVYLLGIFAAMYFARDSGGACPGGSPFIVFGPTFILNFFSLLLLGIIMTAINRETKSNQAPSGNPAPPSS